ncbi:MAG: hypothetical protein WCL57_07985 [Chloroflexota bacterium]
MVEKIKLSFFVILALCIFSQSFKAEESVSSNLWGFDKTYGNNGIVDVGGIYPFEGEYTAQLKLRMSYLSEDDQLTVLAVAMKDQPNHIYTVQPAIFWLDQNGKLNGSYVITQTNLLAQPFSSPIWVGFQSKGNAILRDNYQFPFDLKTQMPFKWSPDVKLQQSTFQVLSNDTILSINDEPLESSVDTIQIISNTGNSILETALLGHQAGTNIIHPNSNAITRHAPYQLDPCLEVYDRQGALLKTLVVSNTPVYRPTRCNISLIKPHTDGGFIWVELGEQPSLTPTFDDFEDRSTGGVALIPGGMLRRTDKNFNLDSYFDRCTPESCPCFNITGNYFDYAIQKDGKYVIGNMAVVEGQPKTSWPLEITRCNSDGSYDMSFGSNGRMVAFGVGGWGFILRLQSDGKILVLSNLYLDPPSYSYHNAVRVMRFAPITATKQTFLPMVR